MAALGTTAGAAPVTAQEPPAATATPTPTPTPTPEPTAVPTPEPTPPPAATPAPTPEPVPTPAPPPLPDEGTPAPDPKPKPAIRGPSRRRGATVARVVARSFARKRLRIGAKGRRIGTTTDWSRQAQVLLVLDSRRWVGREWVKLLLPHRPNGSVGWVPRDNVVLGRTPYWIRVQVRARRVTVFRDGKRVRRFRAVVGAPSTPTPRGLAAVYERNRQPDPGAFLGPWALPLTALSNVLESYGGGPGRVALHGRAGASLRDPLGTARSHGCIRVLNRDISWMARRIPAGTPVRITR